MIAAAAHKKALSDVRLLMRAAAMPGVGDRLRGLERAGTPHRSQREKPDEDWRDDLARRKRLMEKHEAEDWKLDLAQKRAWLDEHEVDCMYSSGRRRSAAQLVRDGVFSASFLKAREGRERRMDALVEVMCALPDEDCGQLGETFRTGGVLLSIPKTNVHGHIKRVKPYTRREFYLNPALEDRSVSWVRYVTAHECGHLLHHYNLSGSTDQMEREADAAAARWGFREP